MYCSSLLLWSSGGRGVAEKEAVLYDTFGSFWLWSIQGGTPFIQEVSISPFAFMAMKVTDVSFVTSCMTLLIISCKIFKWDKPGSLRFVSYLEELKERERQTGKRWPFLYGIGPERMKRSEVAQSCPTLCDPMYCSPPGSSVHGILQARILEWVAISSSRGSSWPRDWTQVSCIAGRLFTDWPGDPRKDVTVLKIHWSTCFHGLFFGYPLPFLYWIPILKLIQ